MDGTPTASLCQNAVIVAIATPEGGTYALDASDLRVFEAVARLGGMNRAAEALNTVQSNVTARIRALEDELGQPLFHRSSRGVTLTAAGKRLLPFAERSAALFRDAKSAVDDTGSPKGELAIGSLETTTAMRLSPVLATYVAAYPDVDLILRTGTTRELIESVLGRELSGAFVCGPVDHPELHVAPVFDEELVLVSSLKRATLEQALNDNGAKIIVLRAGCSYRERLESVLASRGITCRKRLEFGTIEGILSCVAAGLGFTLLTLEVVEATAYRGRVAGHRLAPDEGRVQTVFVRRHDAYVPSALNAFRELAKPGAAERDAAE